MDEPAMHDDALYEEAQHLYRRREELEAMVDGLCAAHQLQLIIHLEAFARLDPTMAKLIVDMIQLSGEEDDLASRLGPGWKADERGISYSPFQGGGRGSDG